jgi:hypothetical protein
LFSLEKMPQEVLERIVKQLDQGSQASLGQVSTAMNIMTVPTLYREIVLDDEERLNDFILGHDLASKITHPSTGGALDHIDTLKLRASPTASQAHLIASSLKNLKVLEIGRIAYYDRSYQDLCNTAEAFAHKNRLHSLTLINHHVSGINAWLQGSPGIKHLTLEDVGEEDEEWDMEDCLCNFDANFPQLETFSTLNALQARRIQSYVARLLRHSQDTLVEWTLEGEAMLFPTPSWAALLPAVLPTLSKLVFLDVPCPLMRAVIKVAPRLKALEISINHDHWTHRSPLCEQHILANIPDTLHSLILRRLGERSEAGDQALVACITRLWALKYSPLITYSCSATENGLDPLYAMRQELLCILRGRDLVWQTGEDAFLLGGDVLPSRSDKTYSKASRWT